jgi:hypothetical protein
MFRKSIFVDLVAGEEGLIGLRPQKLNMRALRASLTSSIVNKVSLALL